MHKLLPLLIALLVVAGCQAQPAATAPTPTRPAGPTAARPTPVPTLAPRPSVAAPTPSADPIGPPAATAAPTAAPAPGGPLPAPLYVLDNGQIARIERDGARRSLVTEETVEVPGLNPVATFAMSPQGLLAFVVGDLRSDRLVLTGPRGEERRILYEQEGHELSDLAWSADGEQIYLRLLNNRQPPDLPSGVYRIAAAGGKPELLRADDPVDNPTSPSPAISGYRPLSSSPDGAHLLVEVYSLFYDGCSFGVIPAGGGAAIVRLDPPPEAKTYCGEAAWSADSAAVYFLAGPDTGPTIWRGDVASGKTSAMAAADMLARAPHPLAGGGLRFFLVRRDAATSELRFALAELAAPQAAPIALGPPFSDRLGRVLWAPDGSGAVTAISPPETQVDLRWMPVGGEPVSLPNTNQNIGELAWGPAD